MSEVINRVVKSFSEYSSEKSNMFFYTSEVQGSDPHGVKQLSCLLSIFFSAVAKGEEK